MNLDLDLDLDLGLGLDLDQHSQRTVLIIMAHWVGSELLASSGL